MNRRSFLDFMGRGLVVSPLIPSILSSCTSGGGEYLTQAITGIAPQSSDKVVLADGLRYEVLVKWGDPIGKDIFFGYNNDFIAFLPNGRNKGLLWVNHESVAPILSSGYIPENARFRNQIRKEMLDVGGSIFQIKKRGKWEIDLEHSQNNKLTGADTIPFEWPERIAGATEAVGTLANCSGGVTPWGTILTCEENYDLFYGEKNFQTGEYKVSKLQWESFFPSNRTEHYGWVVEYDPETKEAKKHISLGRFAHECATVVELSDGRVVVYSGDDKNDGCLYKYISDESGKIFPGKLYVGNFESGVWEPLSYDRSVLNEKFDSETEMLIRTREAAELVGGSPLDRPEDIEIDPIDGSVVVALTNNKPKGDYFGSIMKLKETAGYDGLAFSYETFLTGGEETGFACPDNLVFDPAGNLWFTSDISGSSIGTSPYEPFGNNGLFVAVRDGVNAGQVFQMASAPNEAEFTGPCFGPDGTLFLSVQHPGESSPSVNELTSTWPDGPGNLPKPSVIAISGEMMADFTNPIS